MLLILLTTARPGSASAAAVIPLVAPGGALLGPYALLLAPGQPAAPTDLWVGAISPTEVGLNWIDHSTDETGYDIGRKTGSGDWTQIGVAPARAIHFVDATVTTDVLYTYRVRAHNDLSASAWSNEATITVPPLPVAPIGLRATAIGAARVQLTWIGQNEIGSFFIIERRTLRPNGSDFALIGTQSSNYPFFIDEAADPNTSYAYRVGADVYYSTAWSNEASVTAPPSPAGVFVQAMVPPDPDPSGNTRVTLGFGVLKEFQLTRNPYVVVADASGAVLEFLPAHVTVPLPIGQGYRDLHTELYRAGVYQVRAQLYLQDASGQPGSAPSPWLPLTIPAPMLTSLTLGPATVVGGQTAGGTVQLAGGSRNQTAVVTLASSKPAAAAVPASVSVPSWLPRATFPVTTSAVTTPTTVTITASWNGVSRSASLIVTPAAGTTAIHRPPGRG